MTSNGKSCDYDTLTITIQYQPGLEMIGVGVAGQVYSLDDDIVLKACIIFQPPTTNCTTRDLWYHASETVFNFSLLRDEKAVLRWLTQHPHPNIMEAIHPHNAPLWPPKRMFSVIEDSGTRYGWLEEVFSGEDCPSRRRRATACVEWASPVDVRPEL